MLKRFIRSHLDYLFIALLVVGTSFVLWLPFFLRAQSWFGLQIPESSLSYIYRHFDGPLYIVPAKTGYDPQAIQNLNLEQNSDPKYYSAHLPLYPLFIFLLDLIVTPMQSMILVNLFFSILLAGFFYYFVRYFKFSNHPLMLTFVFIMLPRFLIVRSVGAPESLFMFMLLVSLFAFEKGNYWLAGLFGALACATKLPGILLVPAYLAVVLENWLLVKQNFWKHNLRKWPLILIPFGLFLVFSFYWWRTGDFWAYWHTGGVVPLLSPFAMFNHAARWVQTAWLEDILFYFFVYICAVFSLKQVKQRSLFYFVVIFLLASSLIQHRDLARYLLPIWPLAVIGLEKFFTSRQFYFALLVLLPAIFLYAWNFMTYNVMPISDWTPYL